MGAWFPCGAGPCRVFLGATESPVSNDAAPWRTVVIVDVRYHLSSGALVALLAVSFMATPVAAQIPDEFTNLRVLPEDISRRELVRIMRNFTAGLGVRCSYCHLTFQDRDDDYAADDRAPKETAREMMAMVQAINGDHINRLANRGDHNLEVGCITCHSGRPQPATLDQEMTWAAEEGGYSALEARYNELREEYFGGGSYDFGPRPLEKVAQALARDDAEAALAVVDLNLQHHPESIGSWMLKGQINAFEEHTAEAITAYERALELAPGDEDIEKALARVTGGGL